MRTHTCSQKVSNGSSSSISSYLDHEQNSTERKRSDEEKERWRKRLSEVFNKATLWRMSRLGWRKLTERKKERDPVRQEEQRV